ncbi:MAG: hypothetical protein ACTSWN_08310 [Promethearchaeota archaeon]
MPDDKLAECILSRLILSITAPAEQCIMNEKDVEVAIKEMLIVNKFPTDSISLALTGLNASEIYPDIDRAFK